MVILAHTLVALVKTWEQKVQNLKQKSEMSSKIKERGKVVVYPIRGVRIFIKDDHSC